MINDSRAQSIFFGKIIEAFEVNEGSKFNVF